jgi:thymidylate kinase
MTGLTTPHPYPGRLIVVEGIDGQVDADRAAKAGMTVLADRYVYTTFGRDVARGVDNEWVRALYSFAPIDAIQQELRVAVGRYLARDSRPTRRRAETVRTDRPHRVAARRRR